MDLQAKVDISFSLLYTYKADIKKESRKTATLFLVEISGIEPLTAASPRHRANAMIIIKSRGHAVRQR